MPRIARSSLLLLTIAVFCFAQDYGAKRSVHGTVRDQAGRPVARAVVQIENMKSLQIRSYLTDKDGTYIFHGLSADIDYQICAQRNGKSSDQKILSRFNSSKDAVVNLQLPL